MIKNNNAVVAGRTNSVPSIDVSRIKKGDIVNIIAERPDKHLVEYSKGMVMNITATGIGIKHYISKDINPQGTWIGGEVIDAYDTIPKDKIVAIFRFKDNDD
jgi:hypothetical protein